MVTMATGVPGGGRLRFSLPYTLPQLQINNTVVMVSYPVSYRIKTKLNVYTSVVMILISVASDVDFILGGNLPFLRCKGPDATCLYLELCCCSFVIYCDNVFASGIRGHKEK
jgi:hypothetical protein